MLRLDRHDTAQSSASRRCAPCSVLLSVALLAGAAIGAETTLVARRGPYVFVTKPYTVDLIGWDSQAHRVYYLTTAATTPDSTHLLRCFDLDSTQPQEPRTLAAATKGEKGDADLMRLVGRLRRTCARLDSVRAPRFAEVKELGGDTLQYGSLRKPGYRLLISEGIGPGRCRANARCEGADLVVRWVLGPRSRPERIAVLEMPRGGCEECNPMLLLLLSPRPLPVRDLIPSHAP